MLARGRPFCRTNGVCALVSVGEGNRMVLSVLPALEGQGDRLRNGRVEDFGGAFSLAEGGAMPGDRRKECRLGSRGAEAHYCDCDDP